jgi:hypothetical protein
MAVVQGLERVRRVLLSLTASATELVWVKRYHWPGGSRGYQIVRTLDARMRASRLMTGTPK